MKTRKNIILIIICIVICMGLIAYGLIGKKESDPMDNYITNALVAKDVALMFHSMEEISNNEKSYFDESLDEWYVPYINMMYSDEFYSTRDVNTTIAGATEAFTYGSLEKLFTNMGVVDKELLSFVNNNNSGKKITLSEWVDVYECMVRKLDVNKNILKIETIIVGTPSNSETIEKWSCKTSYGDLKFTGLSVDYYIDKKITVYVRDRELLLVGEVISEDVTYDNAWVITMEGGKIKTFINGVVREFISTDKTTAYSNIVADISLKSGKIDEFKVKTSAISGKVLSSGKDGIEIENRGFYELDENVKIYRTFGALSMLEIGDILVGYDVGQYFVEDGKITAVVVDRDVNAENIRVLIMTNGFDSIYHEKVTLVSENGMTITSGDNIYEIPAYENVSFDVNNEWLKNGRVYINSTGINGKISISSINRGQGIPAYRGTLELNIYDGKIVIINELPVEKYLLSVVPSEMPFTYNIEALKAQAICARSYAYKQILGNGYSKYGAHVDDSTNYQVYNNANEQESTTQAVEETYGKVITYGDEVITAYFFSTSCGSTTDSSVWGSVVPYTEGRILNNDENTMDLSKNETFDAFIRVSYDTFDSEYPWYRWNISLSLEEITSIVNSHIGEICSLSQGNVFVLNENGDYVNEYVSDIGSVKKIEAVERGAGGVLNTVIIYGSEKTIKVTKELNIRKLFNVSECTIKRLNGSDVDGFPLLPSAYVIFDPIITDNLLSGYNIIGGGYGHGVGLSQNGANYLGKNGCSVEEIIKFFYKDVEITKLY